MLRVKIFEIQRGTSLVAVLAVRSDNAICDASRDILDRHCPGFSVLVIELESLRPCDPQETSLVANSFMARRNGALLKRKI